MSTPETKHDRDEASETEIKWDEQYDDPHARIILVSADSVGFRVNAWTFSKKRYAAQVVVAGGISVFIKNLLDIPSHQSIESAPIHLDHPSIIVRTFVNHVYSDLPIACSLTLAICTGVFELCDHFEAPQVYTTMSQNTQDRLQIAEHIREMDVWEVFKAAAIRDDVELATAAIKAFDLARLSAALFQHNQKSVARFDGLPTRYSVNLLMARHNTVGTPRDSIAIAQAFARHHSKQQ